MFDVLGVFVFIEAFTFVFIFIIDLVYAWRKGNWNGLSSWNIHTIKRKTKKKLDWDGYEFHFISFTSLLDRTTPNSVISTIINDLSNWSRLPVVPIVALFVIVNLAYDVFGNPRPNKFFYRDPTRNSINNRSFWSFETTHWI